MVVFEEVTKKFGRHTVAVDALDLDITEGELVVLIGPSGCGKTTTLRMVNRLAEPTSGRITVDGEDIASINPVNLRRNIGYVIQEIGLFPHMTVADNIGIVPVLKKWSRARRSERVDELLDLVDMDPAVYRNRYPRELSGGQQQRIGVLRALAVNPDILLMDEPFGALDPMTRDQLQEELKKLQERVQKTIIFVTHDMDEALKLGDRVVLMRDGKVVQVDSPEEMLRNPADGFVREFIGRDRLLRSPLEVLVGEVMHANPVTIRAHQGLAQALDSMRKRKVDSLLVVDGDRAFQGLVSAEQVQRHLSDERRDQVGEIMDRDVPSITAQATVMEAVDLMSSRNARVLGVTDEECRLVGIMTRSSLVDILSDVMWNANGTREGETASTPRSYPSS